MSYISNNLVKIQIQKRGFKNNIPVKYPVSTMRSLLAICMTETPFEFEGDIYVQLDGASMGSPLGPTSADFYVSEIENKLLNQNKITNPRFYRKYVDDILAIFTNKSHVSWFKPDLLEILY